MVVSSLARFAIVAMALPASNFVFRKMECRMRMRTVSQTSLYARQVVQVVGGGHDDLFLGLRDAAKPLARAFPWDRS